MGDLPLCGFSGIEWGRRIHAAETVVAHNFDPTQRIFESQGHRLTGWCPWFFYGRIAGSIVVLLRHRGVGWLPAPHFFCGSLQAWTGGTSSQRQPRR